MTFGVHFDIITEEKYPKGDAAMDSQYLQIQTLLEQRAEITARLNLIPYDGSIEIKDRNGQKCQLCHVIFCIGTRFELRPNRLTSALPKI